MSKTRKELGNQGELEVVKLLQSQGFTIRAQNYATRAGEIDIIAQKRDLLVFVEVKARRNQPFQLSQVITRSKQKKIIKTALAYGTLNRLREVIYRFDVALLEISLTGEYTITYIADAFTAPDNLHLIV